MSDQLVSASEDSQPSMTSSRSGGGGGGGSDKKSFFKRLDQDYLSPLFGGPPEV